VNERESRWHDRQPDDFRIRLTPADEHMARVQAFGGYPQGESWRLLRLALHEIDVLRADGDSRVAECQVCGRVGEWSEAAE
jgi:hypothetical protein